MLRRRAPSEPHRVVLYTQENCSLCDRARAILEAIGHPFETAWSDEYVFRIPVVEVDGKVVAEGQVRERAVRRALR
jgi:disulfide oxidoreductase YuzD